jgi:RNA polymerase sigma factor (sigma-70 family)
MAAAATATATATDPSAIEDMYRRYGASVLRRARRLLRDEAAAHDAMHDVFLKAWDAGETFRQEASPMTWLYRITTNHCLNQLRNQHRRAEILRARKPNEPALAIATDQRLLAVELLAALPDELREIAVYYFIDQMSHDEIAAVLGLSRRTIGNRVDALRGHFLDHQRYAA